MTKNITVELDDCIEILMFDKDGNLSGKAYISKQHRHILEKHKFYVQKRERTSYAYTNIRINGKRRTFGLHQMIALELYGECPEGKTVDHIDLDGLNNRDSNIRYAEPFEQSFNQRTKNNNTSGHRGVTFYKRSGKWRARLNYKGKEYGGNKLFETFEEAVRERLRLEQLRKEGRLL